MPLPWLAARQRARLRDGERDNSEIELNDMYEYYDVLTSAAAEDV